MLAIVWLFPVESVVAAQQVHLQLKYLHQFQFAGYYAALEKGYYREAGLEVKIDPGDTGDEPLERVLSGPGEYGVSSSSLLLQRYAGKPVVVLAVIFQHSPYVLVAPHTGPTQTIHDMIGKKVMLAAQSEELRAYLKKEGIPLDKLTLVKHSFNPDDLIKGEVYGFSAYATNETDYLDHAGFEYEAYTPRSSGIDFYGDNLFTSEQEISEHPARVKAFHEASMRGWLYAMSHQEEIVDLILAKYSRRNKREHLLYEARQMTPLVQPVLVELGYMNPGRWRHISETYADLDMLPRNMKLDGFMYEPNQPPDLKWVYASFISLIVLSTIVSAIYFRRLTKERKHAQEKIRESEERLQFALEGAGYGVWDWDVKTGEVLYSPRWKEMHGYTSDDHLHRIDIWRSIVHPDDIAKTALAVRNYFTGRTSQFFNEYRIQSKNGEWKWVVDRGMIVARDKDGKALRMVCTHADVTERKKNEEKLKQLNESLETKVEERTRELSQAMEQIIESQKLASLGSLVAGISHELNTPLGNILMVASTLGDKLDSLYETVQQRNLSRQTLYSIMDECRRASEMIVRNANRSVELIESFKRISVDQTSQRRRVFDLAATIQDVLNTFGPALRRANVNVNVDIERPIEMDSFPGHLEQILNNLISNSLLHGFENKNQGEITIRATSKDNKLELLYQDNGIGIPKELQHRVFEPFYTTKLGQGGSGLGLSIVHNLVQAIFKGRLQLKSEPGKGTTVTFQLPLQTPGQTLMEKDCEII